MLTDFVGETYPIYASTGINRMRHSVGLRNI